MCNIVACPSGKKLVCSELTTSLQNVSGNTNILLCWFTNYFAGVYICLTRMSVHAQAVNTCPYFKGLQKEAPKVYDFKLLSSCIIFAV